MDSNIHNLTMFCSLLTKSVPSLQLVLGQDSTSRLNNFTVFAAINEGFADVAEGLASLSNEDALKTILFHFQLNQQTTWENLACSKVMMMGSGDYSRTFCRSSSGMVAKAQKGGG